MVRHHEVVSDCWDNPSEACMKTGVGPETYDCSGLVVASLCEALGISLKQWPLEMRHVRDFWNAGSPNLGERKDFSDVTAGDLLIVQKRIPIQGLLSNQPCHIAIVSKYTPDEMSIIHAVAESGKVVEEQPSQSWISRRVMGAIALSHGS